MIGAIPCKWRIMMAKKKEVEKQYSVTEVAAIKRKPYHKIIREINKGQYPNAYKVGHGWVIPAKDVK